MKFKHVILGIMASMLLVSCNGKTSNNSNNDNLSSEASTTTHLPSDDSSSTSTHTHTFASGWENDETYHWHKSTCGHDVVGGKEEHSFKEEVTNPTYDAEGYTTHTCTVCEYSYVDSETSKLTHNYASTWSSDKDSHWHACTDNGYESLIKDKDDHYFKVETIAPTYEVDGYTKHTCTVCGYSYNDNKTSKLEHNYSDEWSHDESYHWHACTDKGYETLKGYEAKHDFKDTVTPATYDAGGYTTHTCSVCNYSYKDNKTAKLTHNYATTWSSDKDNHWHACTDEGYESLKTDEAKHTFKDEVIAPTFDKGGYTLHTCTVCDYSYKDNETPAEREAKLGIIPVINKEKNALTYGLYPQTHVNDTNTIAALNALTTAESNGWYLYNGEYYAKKSAEPYGSTDKKFNDGTTIDSGTAYWFKCEPIEWKILTSSDGSYSLVSTVLLDAHRYNEDYSGTNDNGYYANNYMNSEIRSWLNDDFLKTAFNLDSSLIQTTTVDNSESTTNSSSNKYACENTEDKVYLLSYQDYTNYSYFPRSSTRECKTTDYARANFIWYSTNSSYYYNGWYWTRSPDSYYSDRVLYVYNDGDFLVSSNPVFYQYLGVRPAITIKL